MVSVSSLKPLDVNYPYRFVGFSPLYEELWDTYRTHVIEDDSARTSKKRKRTLQQSRDRGQRSTPGDTDVLLDNIQVTAGRALSQLSSSSDGYRHRSTALSSGSADRYRQQR